MKHIKTKYKNFGNGLPLFEPNDKDISLSECVNVDKYIELIKEIESAFTDNKISSDEYKFLKLCASRWIKFNYSNVAQYFCKKASPEMQQLLQRSVMVLLDIDDAFKSGVIQAKAFISSLQSELLKNRAEENPDMSEFDDMTEELEKYSHDPDEIYPNEDCDNE